MPTPSDLEFTGERFVPGIAGEIAHEHWHRYAFARRFVTGRRVLDVACGEGYGSALLAAVAGSVVGVDIAQSAIAHASAAYAGRANLNFAQGSAAAVPIADGAVDVVVSFETIEHLPHADQPRMAAEIARVLAPDGMLILSAPNPVEYSQARNYANPFHLYEPTREEIDALLATAFAARRWYRQRRYFGSALWSEDAGAEGFEALAGDANRVDAAIPPPAMYYVVIAARTAAALPPPGPGLSLFADRDEAELARLDARAAEVMRLDALVGEREAAIERQTAHVRHLEGLVEFRDRIVVERDQQLVAVNAARDQVIVERDTAAAARDAAAAARDATLRERDAALQERATAAAALASARQALDALKAECERLERALAAQERIIAYRQSARWWLALPWVRAQLWWQRMRRR
ncbi:MAG: class I SAM-dependent methyltransferase [Casimicrobiaceae bacterium]